MAQHELIADAFSGNVKLAKKVHDAMRRLANTPLLDMKLMLVISEPPRRRTALY
jgi:hypothetical protein